LVVASYEFDDLSIRVSVDVLARSPGRCKAPANDNSGEAIVSRGRLLATAVMRANGCPSVEASRDFGGYAPKTSQ
jgi:hypothetical protein